MASLYETLTIEGKSLRTRFTVIVSLLFVQPFFIVAYILYREDLYRSTEYLILAFFVLLLVLGGVFILRQVFDKFIVVTDVMKKAEAGEMVVMEVHKDTAELRDISIAFNRIMSRLEEATGQLQRQAVELQQALAGRDAAEKAFRESEMKYCDLVENMNEIVFRADREGIVTYINAAVEQFGGYSSSEVMGKCFREFIHPDDAVYVDEAFRQSIDRVSLPIEYRVVSKSGEIRWVRSFGRTITEEGNVVGIQGVLTDITDLKLAEKGLQQQLDEVERLNKLMVGRELKMEEMRKKMGEMEARIERLKSREAGALH